MEIIRSGDKIILSERKRKSVIRAKQKKSVKNKKLTKHEKKIPRWVKLRMKQKERDKFKKKIFKGLKEKQRKKRRRMRKLENEKLENEKLEKEKLGKEIPIRVTRRMRKERKKVRERVRERVRLLTPEERRDEMLDILNEYPDEYLTDKLRRRKEKEIMKLEKERERLEREKLAIPPAMTMVEKISGLSDWSFEEVRRRLTRRIEFSNSLRDGKHAFAWLIGPTSTVTFLNKAWEKGPVHVKRKDHRGYYRELLSTEKINEILQNNHVLFSKHIDVTSYRDGKQETHSPSGRANPVVVWDFYEKGCSIKMLNTHIFSPELMKLSATLQEFFCCFVGTNSYLTPPGSQGFAPHYDDTEAFILQLEGRKHWKVYAPRSPEEVLPRRSSADLCQDDLGLPVMEVTLEPGDLLYFPRGFAHQASTDHEQHSLHVTLSCYQKNTWGDFLEKVLSALLALATEQSIAFRSGLPVGYLSHLGMWHTDISSMERSIFVQKVSFLMDSLINSLFYTASADQMAKRFMHEALPPVLNICEEECSVFSPDNVNFTENGTAKASISLTLDSGVKLLRAHILRLVKEDPMSDNVHVYHCVDNSVEHHGEELQSFQVSSAEAKAIGFLIKCYPNVVTVGTLPLQTKEEQLKLGNFLWRKGLIITDKPLAEYIRLQEGKEERKREEDKAVAELIRFHEEKEKRAKDEERRQEILEEKERRKEEGIPEMEENPNKKKKKRKPKRKKTVEDLEEQ